MSNRYQQAFCVIAIASLLMAIFPLPYGYYVLLRIVVTIAAAYMVYVSYIFNKRRLLYIFGVIAILFNPVIKVPLDKSIWILVDIITAITFFVALVKVKKIN